MLTLTRKPKESVVIGEGRESVIVTVKAIEPGKVRLSFQARRHVPIDRLEVRLDKMAREQAAEKPQVAQSEEPQIAQIAQRGQDQNPSAESEKSADDDHPPQVEESHKPQIAQIAQRGQNENPSAESAKSADDGPKPTCERAYRTKWPVSSTGEVCSPLVAELVRLMDAGWSVESIAASMPHNLSRAAEVSAARQNSRRSLQIAD